MKQYICIDIGGTEIKHGVLDENEKFLAKGKVPTEAFKGGPALLKKVMGIAADYLKDRKKEGICVSTAGMSMREQRSRPAWRRNSDFPARWRMT